MSFEVVGDFGLQVFARLRPLLKEFVLLFKLNKQMVGGFGYRCGTAERADWIDQFGRRIGCAAFAAIVTVLIFGFANGGTSL